MDRTPPDRRAEAASALTETIALIDSPQAAQRFTDAYLQIARMFDAHRKPNLPARLDAIAAKRAAA